MTAVWIFVMVKTAGALPPGRACDSRLIAEAARPVFRAVTARHPDFDRAYVGNLVNAWRQAPDAIGEWGIYDNHNRQKVFASRWAYTRDREAGARLFLFDRGWTPIVDGKLHFIERPHAYVEDHGVSVSRRRPVLAGQDDPDQTLAAHWVNGVNAIALTRMTAAARAEWDTERADYERWRSYANQPNVIRGRDFSYELAHFESATEGAVEWTTHADGVAIGVRRGPRIEEVTPRDYLLLFDVEDRLIERAKILSPIGRVDSLGETTDPAGVVDLLRRTRRLVVIKDHFFLNERF